MTVSSSTASKLPRGEKTTTLLKGRDNRVNPLEKLPTDFLAGEILSKFLSYPVGKNASKIFRTIPGHRKELGRQFQKVVPRFDRDECLQAILTKYPFLPNDDEMGGRYYIIVKPFFQKFRRDCIEASNLPSQLGRCCYRIEYHGSVIEKIFDPRVMSLKTKESKKNFIKALEGIKETFYHPYTSKPILSHRFNYLYNRLYLFLAEHTHSNWMNRDELLFCLDTLLKLENKLKEKKKIIKNGDNYWKLRTLAQFVHKLATFQDRKDIIMGNDAFWLRLTGSEKNFYEFLSNLLLWQTPPQKTYESLFLDFNQAILEKLYKNQESVPSKIQKMVFGTFMVAIEEILLNHTWESNIDYYLKYLPLFPIAVFNSESISRLLDRMPTKDTTIKDWKILFSYLKKKNSIPKEKMDKMVLKAFKSFSKNIISQKASKIVLLKKLVALYQVLYVEFHDSKPKETMLKLLMAQVKKHHLFGGIGGIGGTMKPKQITLEKLEHFIREHQHQSKG